MIHNDTILHLGYLPKIPKWMLRVINNFLSALAFYE